mmetsp:Transcript_7963/g.22588  ORF Transcript_7963/g.22588 Transcript_7963/m.22588 type:complete len:89 (+) Transcript_7963:1081-1347(+)
MAVCCHGRGLFYVFRALNQTTWHGARRFFILYNVANIPTHTYTYIHAQNIHSHNTRYEHPPPTDVTSRRRHTHSTWSLPHRLACPTAL